MTLLSDMASILGVGEKDIVQALVTALSGDRPVDLPTAVERDADRLAYSPAELAEALGTSVDLVRSAIDRGQIRARRLGRRVLIPTAEVDRLLGKEGSAA